MNTGTPLDLTPFGSMLKGVGILYWLLFAGGIGLVLWKAKTWRGKLIFSTIVVVAVSGPVVLHAVKSNQERKEEQEKFKSANGTFENLCKKAGEKIFKEVGNVSEIELINIRPENVSRTDQFERYDPYGYEGGGDEYIKQYLPGHWANCIGDTSSCPPNRRAFDYVEIRSSNGSSKTVSTQDKNSKKPIAPGSMAPSEIVEISTKPGLAKYGVMWEDISSDEERRLWISGGRITVIDLRSGEVLGERIGYLFDTGMGSTTGSRSPWSWARQYGKSCPPITGHNFTFARKILHSN